MSCKVRSAELSTRCILALCPSGLNFPAERRIHSIARSPTNTQPPLDPSAAKELSVVDGAPRNLREETSKASLLSPCLAEYNLHIAPPRWKSKRGEAALILVGMAVRVGERRSWACISSGTTPCLSDFSGYLLECRLFARQTRNIYLLPPDYCQFSKAYIQLPKETMAIVSRSRAYCLHGHTRSAKEWSVSHYHSVAIMETERRVEIGYLFGHASHGMAPYPYVPVIPPPLASNN